MFQQLKKEEEEEEEEEEDRSTIVASHPSWPWQKKEKRETHTWKNKKQNWKPMRKKEKEKKISQQLWLCEWCVSSMVLECTKLKQQTWVPHHQVPCGIFYGTQFS